MEGSSGKHYKSFRDYLKYKYPTIGELIDTEKEYVKRLSAIVDGYIQEYRNENITIPEDLKGHDKHLIFRNIEEIYFWHKNYFLIQLKEKKENIIGLSKIFIENEHHFHMYAKYNNHKQISDYLINKHSDYFDKVRERCKHKLTIRELTMEPVQRILRYPMLIESLIKHCNKQGHMQEIEHLTEALKVMRKVSSESDEFMVLDGIRNFDDLISDQGKLLHRGSLLCKYNNKNVNFYVFIFKRIILFTEEKKQRNFKVKYNKADYSNSIYDFRLQIPFNKLSMKELPNCQFCLKHQGPNINNCSVICKAVGKEEYRKWMQIIKQELELQNNLIHSLVNPNSEML
ncbi:rho guanine nucleotide exchange factor 25-like [Cochliomyia hominivorax]